MGYHCNSVNDYIRCHSRLLLGTVLSDSMQERAQVRRHANVCQTVMIIQQSRKQTLKSLGGGD